MSKEKSIMIEKPSRFPDFITATGGLVWFEEYIFINAQGKQVELVEDDASGMLRLKDATVKCHDCDKCHNGNICQRNFLNEKVQYSYKTYFNRKFEELVLKEKF